jgi:hypothetical protein
MMRMLKTSWPFSQLLKYNGAIIGVQQVALTAGE